MSGQGLANRALHSQRHPQMLLGYGAEGGGGLHLGYATPFVCRLDPFIRRQPKRLSLNARRLSVTSKHHQRFERRDPRLSINPIVFIFVFVDGIPIIHVMQPMAILRPLTSCTASYAIGQG